MPNLGLKYLVFRDFPSEKLRHQLGLFSHPGWDQQIGTAQLTLALAKVLHLDETLFNLGLEAEIDRAKPHTQILGQRTLTDLGRLMQTVQNFELDFLLEPAIF